MEKMTKAQMFAQIRTHLTDEAEIAFIDHELELLKRKNERKSDKPTKNQIANAGLMDIIYDKMEAGVPYRVKDIQTLVPELAEVHFNKVNALVTKMRENVLVSREVVKGTAYFTKI